MDASKIQGLVEELAEALVMCRHEDMVEIAQAHARFEGIATWAAEEQKARLQAQAEKAGVLLQSIVLEEAADPASALDVVRAIASAAQLIICEGRDENEVLAHEQREAAQAADAQEPGAAAADLTGVAFDDLDPGITAEFLAEAQEHLDAVDVSLLSLESDPEDQEALNAVFRAFHTIKGGAGFLACWDIQRLAHECETLLDKARSGELRFVGARVDATFASADMLKQLIAELASALDSGAAPQTPEGLGGLLARVKELCAGADDADEAHEELRLGEVLVGRGKARQADVEHALSIQQLTPGRKLGEILVQEKQAAAQDVAKALRTQEALRGGGKSHMKEAIKVDADRLDQLVDMIGELVIAEAMVSQSLQDSGDEAGRHLSQLNKITRELQEIATCLRMVPLRSTFQKMARLARDVAQKAGKQVNFEMAGEDSELDKTVVDKIGDPLMHMVRNAIDHGLEATAEARVAAGKAAAGNVTLKAFHQGSNIYIEISDDGRGLDREKILAKARERGIVESGSQLSDSEVWSLIFEAGFSTAEKVTDVSGRGVGMDVVRRNIEALRGQVEIRSEAGKGTTFSVRLPLTLAIIDGMVVRVGQERYIVPTLSIVSAVRPRPEEIQTAFGGHGEMLLLRGQLMPLFRLSVLLNAPGAVQDVTEGTALILERNGRQTALLADELLGQQQIVIKPLGRTFQGIPGLSGGAIMPDGAAGLILDVGDLLKNAEDSPARGAA